MIGYNIGSGQRKFIAPDWINVDCQERWTPDIVADGAHLDMLPDGNAQYVVLHHVLEHYGCGEAVGLVKECHRILAPGGSLLVFVPDIHALCNGWRLGRINTETFMISLYGAYMGDEADRHKWGYIPETLETFLRASAEWSEVKPFNWRPIAHADLARAWWILAFEAVK